MVSKKGNASEEACSCNECKCGSGCCWCKVLTLILAVVGCVAAIMACLYTCKSYKLNVLSAGWEENLQKMIDLYKSPDFVKYMTDQTDASVKSFMETYGIKNEDETKDEDSTIEIEDEDDSNNIIDDTDIYEEDNNNIIAWGDEVKSVVQDMLASAPVRGDKDARFVIVEYTELHCPYCQMHAQNWTINAVIEQFPGEVNSVSRHFIIHGEDALNLASAMECVAELKGDVYHEVFEKAFEAYPVDMDGLISIAAGLGVDEAALKTCADEGRYTQAVNDMMNQGNQLFGINWTPGNVIIDKETWNFIVVSGAYPVDEFVNAINELKNA